MKMKKLGRPKRFKEEVHRLALVLPRSLMVEIQRIAKSRPDDKAYIAHVIFDAITQYVKKH